jgi:hypothetical protein
LNLGVEAIEIRDTFNNEFRKLCPSDEDLVNPGQSANPLIQDCLTMYEYKQQLLYSTDLSRPTLVPTPPALRWKGQSLDAAAAVTKLLMPYNNKVFDYQTKEAQVVHPREIETIKLAFVALLALSFAFGLGIIRRALNAVQDFRVGGHGVPPPPAANGAQLDRIGRQLEVLGKQADVLARTTRTWISRSRPLRR